MYIANNVLKHHLKNVYFVGGTACGGKTTMAQKIAEKYGMIYYNADETMIEHFKIASEAEQPEMSRKFASAVDYFCRPIDEYTQWILDINKEALDMIIVDLIKLSGEKPVIAEGHFDARWIKEITCYNRMVFLYAEEDLLRKDYYSREDKKPMLDAINRMDNPEEVIKHTLDLSVNLTNHQVEVAKDNKVKWFVRDNDSTVEKTMEAIEKHFNLI